MKQHKSTQTILLTTELQANPAYVELVKSRKLSPTIERLLKAFLKVEYDQEHELTANEEKLAALNAEAAALANRIEELKQKEEESKDKFIPVNI